MEKDKSDIDEMSWTQLAVQMGILLGIISIFLIFIMIFLFPAMEHNNYINQTDNETDDRIFIEIPCDVCVNFRCEYYGYITYNDTHCKIPFNDND